MLKDSIGTKTTVVQSNRLNLRSNGVLLVAFTVALTSSTVRTVVAENPLGQIFAPVGGIANQRTGGGNVTTSSASRASIPVAAIASPLQSFSGAAGGLVSGVIGPARGGPVLTGFAHQNVSIGVSNLATQQLEAKSAASGSALRARQAIYDVARSSSSQANASTNLAKPTPAKFDAADARTTACRQPDPRPIAPVQSILPIWHASAERLPGLHLLASSSRPAPYSSKSYSKQASIVPFDGATVRHLTPQRVELELGSLLVVANGAPVEIATRLASVQIRKSADVLVKVENGVLRVQNLDAAHSGVQVDLPGQKSFAVGPGYELITAPQGLTRDALVPADGVGRRNVVLSSEGTVAVGEIQLAGVIGNQLKKQLNRADSSDVKKVLDRVLKTAAVIQITRGNIGFSPGGPAGAVPPANVPVPSLGLLPEGMPPEIPPVPGVPPTATAPPSATPANATVTDSSSFSLNVATRSTGGEAKIAASVGATPIASAVFDGSRQVVRNVLESPSSSHLDDNSRRTRTIDEQTPSLSNSTSPQNLGQRSFEPSRDTLSLQGQAVGVTGQMVPDTVLDQNLNRRRAGGPATVADSGAAAANTSGNAPAHEILKAARESIRAFPELVLFVLLLIVSLLLLSLVLARSAMVRARQVEAMNNRLEVEVAERRLLEQQAIGLNNDLERRISDMAILNEELSQARDRALQASKLKSEFVANISHEIRTPISAVIGINELLLTSALQPKQREYAQLVGESAQSLLTVINDILDFSKIEAGMIELNNVQFAAGTVLKEVSDVVSASVRQKGVFFLTAIDDKIPQSLTGDPTRLRQVLLNLVGNSMKFTARGEIVLQAVLVPEQPGFVRFSVQDTGIGIAPEAQSKLFQPFVQADGSTTRRFGGTGLGLSISKRLVDLMGGQIMMESSTEKGSHFWCDVPLFDPENTQLPLPSGADADGARHELPLHVPEITALSKSVLVVSAQPYSPNLLRQQLEDTGFDAEVSGGEDEALARLYDSPVDVVVIETGTCSGLAQKIRDEELFEDIALVGLQISDAVPGDSYDAWLPSPVNSRDVVRWINSLLDHEDFAAVASPGIAVPLLSAVQDVSRASVLVAEDSPVLQQMISVLFEKLGYRVELVDNGREAVEAASNGNYSLIFMDWQMPEMDGLEATRNIRKGEAAASSHTPIIAMTANAMQGDKETCLTAGMDDYISKPFTFEQLQTIVGRWIRESS